MGAVVQRTLRGGPHHGLRLELWEPLPPAFRLEREVEGVYAPDAVYVLRTIKQKSRTIRVYEYVEDWERERENTRRRKRAERLKQLRRKILAHIV
jgi:hypothetical protein